MSNHCWYPYGLSLALICCCGCGQAESRPSNPPAPTALTLEQWKELPVPEKYDEAAFERLRLGNAKLKSDRAWHAYMAKEIMPERNQDIPKPASTSATSAPRR